MSFDNTCRRLAEKFPQDFASWLLGIPMPLTVLQPTELSLEHIRSDSLILLQGKKAILHIEFQTAPKPNLSLRLADYRIRIHRKFPGCTIYQIVIYLRKTRSPMVYQTQFSVAGMTGSFQIVRLWEVPPEELMNYPGILPFAVLGQTTNPERTLRQAVRSMGQLSEDQQHETLGAAYILSGLRLEADVVAKIIRRDMMRESTTYQAILEEGREEGIELGKLEERQEIARNLMQEGLDPGLIAKVARLSLEDIRRLSRGVPPATNL
jgi:predicted transposase/invertase (TIGR01784 family)